MSLRTNQLYCEATVLKRTETRFVISSKPELNDFSLKRRIPNFHEVY